MRGLYTCTILPHNSPTEKLLDSADTESYFSFGNSVENSTNFERVIAVTKPNETCDILAVFDFDNEIVGILKFNLLKKKLCTSILHGYFSYEREVLKVLGGTIKKGIAQHILAAAMKFIVDIHANCTGFYFPEINKSEEAQFFGRKNPHKFNNKKIYYEIIEKDWHLFKVPDIYENYMSALPKKRRYNLRRQRKILEDAFIFPVHFIEIISAEQIDILFNCTKLLFEEFSEYQENFYRACADNGLIRSFVLESGGQALAVALAISDGKDLIVQRMMFNHSFAHLSPGTDIWERMIEYAAKVGITRIILGFGMPAVATSSRNVIEKRSSIIIYIDKADFVMIAHNCLKLCVAHFKNAFNRNFDVRRNEIL